MRCVVKGRAGCGRGSAAGQAAGCARCKRGAPAILQEGAQATLRFTQAEGVCGQTLGGARQRATAEMQAAGSCLKGACQQQATCSACGAPDARYFCRFGCMHALGDHPQC